MMSIYLLPIFLINLIYRKLIFNKETIISLVLSFFIITILIYLFKPVSHWLGGGVVYQLSIKLFGNNYLFYLSSFFTFFMFINFGLENKKNFILEIILLFVFLVFKYIKDIMNNALFNNFFFNTYKVEKYIF